MTEIVIGPKSPERDEQIRNMWSFISTCVPGDIKAQAFEDAYHLQKAKNLIDESFKDASQRGNTEMYVEMRQTTEEKIRDKSNGLSGYRAHFEQANKLVSGFYQFLSETGDTASFNGTILDLQNQLDRVHAGTIET